jgi:hypothetical protein
MGRKSASGSGIRDEQPGSYFLELRNIFLVFLGLKYLDFFMGIRDLGWKKVGSGIRDKHPGSTTLDADTNFSAKFRESRFETVSTVPYLLKPFLVIVLKRCCSATY